MAAPFFSAPPCNSQFGLKTNRPNWSVSTGLSTRTSTRRLVCKPPSGKHVREDYLVVCFIHTFLFLSSIIFGFLDFCLPASLDTRMSFLIMVSDSVQFHDFYRIHPIHLISNVSVHNLLQLYTKL